MRYHLDESMYFRRQCGSALLTAILMIFLLALMGDSAMRSATLETKLVANAIQTREVFLAADSSTEQALNDSQNLLDAFNSTSGSILIETDMGENAGLESQVIVRYISESNATGVSLDAMQGASAFEALQFVAEGTAGIASLNSYRRIDQGAMRIVPAN